jgi:endoribonuclease Dicer
LLIKGSGKTLIAILLLRYILDQELEHRLAGLERKVAFFLVCQIFDGNVDCKVDNVNLVFQQHRVLEINLDHPMDKFCGEMGSDLWTKEVWQKHFDKNMVIVCTAQVLANCLTHAFIDMRHINLIVFDEAHRAKGNHVYAK